jgi:cell division septation protein DedD
MSILAKGARVLPPRMHRAYRLEMSGRTLLTLLSLLTLTGLVVFYLGVVTGKGLRDPNPPVAATATPPGTPATAQAGAAANPSGLTFNQALTAPNGQIEGLKTEQSKVSAQTQNLLSRAQELELEEVPAKTPLASAAAPAPKTPAMKAASTSPATASVAKAVPTPQAAASAAKAVPTPQAAAPAAKAVSAPAATAAAPKAAAAPAPARAAPKAAPAGAGGFTVQVFSSTQQKSAQDLMADLKKKGYAAYLNQYQAEDKKTWYRVRVGHGTRAEVEALAERLKHESNVAAPRVLKQ